MRRSLMLLPVLLAALMTAPTAVAGVTFDAFDDFSGTSNAEGDIWTYRYQDGGQALDGNYELLSNYAPRTSYPWLPIPPADISLWRPGSELVPYLGINDTGVTKTLGNTDWPSGVMSVHPGVGELVMVSWQSPADMRVDVNYRFTDITAYDAGDGILWYIEHRSASGAIGETLATAQLPVYGDTGLRGMSGINVAAGDFLHFIVHQNGDLSSDATSVVARIKESPRRARFDAFDDFSGVWNPDGPWSYRYQDGSTVRDGNYELLGRYGVRAGYPWVPTDVPVWVPTAGDLVPFLGANQTGSAQTFSNSSWPDGTISAHPGVGELVMLSWESPRDMLANVDYQFQNLNTPPGGDTYDGVLWFVEHRNASGDLLADLDSGSITVFGGDSGLLRASRVSLAAGDVINFIVHQNSVLSDDQTMILARINEIPEPASLVLLAVGVLGLIAFRRRRQGGS